MIYVMRIIKSWEILQFLQLYMIKLVALLVDVFLFKVIPDKSESSYFSIMSAS